MPRFMVFIFGVMVGTLFGMFLMAMLVTSARSGRAELWP